MQTAKTQDMGGDIGLRQVFDNQAQQYNDIRPHYPEALFDTLVYKTHLSTDARLLEIGPGTGQATLPLARRGFRIVAVELGANMAALARQQLKAHPRVEVMVGAFEDVKLPEQFFDLVYSATALHWIRPDVRYTKSHRLLRPGGYLAVVHTNHVSDEQGDEFFYASQPIYDKYIRASEKAPRLPRLKELRPVDDIDAKLFKLVHFEFFPLVIEYSAAQYAELLGTYSPHLAMPATTRAAFLHDAKELINRQFGGTVAKHYAMSLTIAQKI